ncbi:hypothetical protein ABY52_27195 [Klebsiella pneumoniae]|nr:hypothetical protein APT87_09965 [Klebsiella pneumoniae]KSX89317.1 hypothetical protein APT92_22600 [Klebsiella pneumoniae]KXA83714.1 hypothetical protein ABY52_27195 [Klebsiella pneumoniae]
MDQEYHVGSTNDQIALFYLLPQAIFARFFQDDIFPLQESNHIAYLMRKYIDDLYDRQGISHVQRLL